MTPDNLRKLSWRMFITAFFCGIVGVMIIVAVPNPSFAGATDPTVRIIARIGFGLIGIMFLTNLLSLGTGAIAWFKGTKHCGWIVISAIFLFAPVAMVVASKLNL